MRKFIFISLLVFGAIGGAMADVASIQYVDRHTDDKVSTNATAKQTMAGTYTVTGVIEVPTPDLPSQQ